MKYDINSINKRKTKMGIIKKILGVVFIIFIYNILLIFISTSNPNNTISLFGYKAYVIISNSMKPSINFGDIVIVKKTNENNLYTGDIITFTQNNEAVTHRIIKIEKDNTNSETTYITKGDNNNLKDIEQVKYNNIEGKKVLIIPYIGRILLVIDNKIIPLVIVFIILIMCFFHIQKQERIESRREKKKIEDKKQKYQENNW